MDRSRLLLSFSPIWNVILILVFGFCHLSLRFIDQLVWEPIYTHINYCFLWPVGQQLHNRTNFESKWKWNINQQGFAKIQMTLRVQITYFVNHIKYGQTVKFKDNSQFQWHLFLLIKFHLRFPFCAIKENCFQDFHLIIFKQKHKTDVTHQQKLNVKYHSHVSLLASGAAVVSKAKKMLPPCFTE